MVLHIENLSVEDGRREIRDLLLDLTRQLDFAIYAITNGNGVENLKNLKEQEDVIKTVFLIIQSIGISIHSIVKLTSNIDMSIRDCYGIARSVSEGALNSAYIISGGSEVAAKARRHALQKSYRNLKRASQLNDIQISHSEIPSISSTPGLADAISEFTTKNGREISEWSGKNIEQKIKTIIMKYPSAQTSASMSNFSIYRHASEILHGSYFGVFYFWNPNGFSKSKLDFNYIYLYDHFIAIFTAIYSSINMIIEVLHAEYEIPELKKMHNIFVRRAHHLFSEVDSAS